MSYFPTPDPERLRIALAEYQSLAQTSALAPGLQSAWNSTPNTTNESMPMQHAMTWPMQESQHHGLPPMPYTTAPMYPQAMLARHPGNTSFGWSSDMIAQQSHEFSNPERRASWENTTYESMSTLHPTTVWPSSQPQPSSSAVAYDASPSLSSYSVGSRLSALSSPYAGSDSYVQAGRSPMVKLEPLDAVHPRMLFAPECMPLEQSRLVNPEDLVSYPQPNNEDHRVSPAFSASVDLEDSDASSRSGFRPGARQKQELSGDEDNELLEDRQRRSMTKPENANFQCDHCGKLFQRSYNLRAHLETHDPDRSHPHYCAYPRCDKRFVRRTDLLRHQESVHLRTRAHRCPLCSSSFARKDTLRRHIDDGCPKRTEVKRRATKPSDPWSPSSSRRPSFQA